MFNSARQLISAKWARATNLAVAGVLAASMAVANGPSFSGPSIAKLAEVATFHGGALPPNFAVTVTVSGPAGSASFGAVTDGAGAMRYQFSAAQTGMHTLTLQDSGGRALASASVNVLP